MGRTPTAALQNLALKSGQNSLSTFEKASVPDRCEHTFHRRGETDFIGIVSIADRGGHAVAYKFTEVESGVTFVGLRNHHAASGMNCTTPELTGSATEKTRILFEQDGHKPFGHVIADVLIGDRA